MSLGGALPAFLTQKALAAGTTVVTPASSQGWTPSTASGGQVDYINSAGAPLGVGALELATNNTNDSVTHLTHSFDTPLSSLSKLSYEAKVLTAPASVDATLRISINLNGDASTADDQLMFEPYYNGTPTSDWQTWSINAANSKFWSNEGNTYNGLGGPGAGAYATNFTLNDVLQDHPNATIVGLVLSVGTGNPSAQILVDNLVFNDSVYDFEATPPATPASLHLTQGAKVLACGASTNTASATANWSTVAGATSYNYHSWTTAAGSSYNSESSAYPANGLTTNSLPVTFNQGDGQYFFEVQAVESGNLSPWSAPCNVTFDQTAPTVNILAPTDNPDINAVVYASNNGNLTISGTATDATSGVIGKTMTIVVTDYSVTPHKALVTQYPVVQANGNWSIIVPAHTLPNGHHMTVSAATRDNATNVGSDHAYFIVDNSVPTINFTSPTPADGTALNHAFGVTVQANDDDTLKSVDAGLFDTNPDGSFKNWVAGCGKAANLNVPNYTLNCTVTLKDGYAPHGPLPDGTYVLRATTQDTAGNWATLNRTIVIDNTAPVTTSITATNTVPKTVNLTSDSSKTSPAVTETLMGKQTTFTVNLDDGSGSGNSGAYIELFKTNYDGTYGTWVKDNTHGDGVRYGSHPTLTANLANYPGKYGLKIVSSDKAGNSVTKYVFFTVDTQGPTAHFTATPPAYVNGNFHVEATASDNFALKDVIFDVRDSSGWVAGCTTDSFTSSPATIAGSKNVDLSCDINTANLVDGQTYTLRVHASDMAGYGGGQDVQFTIDNMAPTVTITSPASGDVLSYAKDGTVEVRGTISDLHPDHYYLKIYGPAGTVYKATVPMTGSLSDSLLYTWNLKGLTSGDYVIDLEAADTVGNKDANSSVQKLHVTIDNTAPVVSIDSYGWTDNMMQPTISVDGSTAPAPADYTYSWTTDPNVDISNVHALNPTFTVNQDGTYDFTLTVTDSAGNSTKVPMSLTYTTPAAPQQGGTPTNPFTVATTQQPTGGTGTPVTAPLADNGTGATTPQILGDSTTKGSNAADVAGDSITVKNASDKKSGDFLGLGWWWLLIIAVLAAGWWLLAAKRRKQDEN